MLFCWGRLDIVICVEMKDRVVSLVEGNDCGRFVPWEFMVLVRFWKN